MSYKKIAIYCLTACIGTSALLPSSLLSAGASAQSISAAQTRPCLLSAPTSLPTNLPIDPPWAESQGQGAVVSQPNYTKPNAQQEWLTAVAFSSNGQSLASGSRYVISQGTTGDGIIGVPGGKSVRGGIQIWGSLNAPQWTANIFHTSKREINAVAFSPNGRFLAAGGGDKGFVGLWNWHPSQSRTEQTPIAQANSQVESLAIAFSPDSRMLVSGGLQSINAQAVLRWNIAGGKLQPMQPPIQEVKEPSQPNVRQSQKVYAVAISPDSKLIAGAGLTSLDRKEGLVFKPVSSKSFVTLWDAQTGKYRCSAGDHEPYSTSIAFSPDGTLLASGGADGTIKIWSLTTSEAPKVWSKHVGRVNAIAFSPSGKILASVGKDRTVKLWQVSTGQMITSFAKSGEEITSITFRPDGQAFATSNKANEIQMFIFSSR